MMRTSENAGGIGLPARIGAWLFVLWSVLHVWVAAEGTRQYLAAGTSGLWKMLIGGHAVSRGAFVHATDPATVFAHGQLILNFCLDVGGYGVLGFFVAWMILRRASWIGYLIGVVVIGVADLAFLFSLVVPGVIELDAGSVAGPLIWIAAVVVTPFGLPRHGRQAI